jgi:predicted dehydrogenase
VNSTRTVTNVGLVGCGYWGSKHLRVLNEIRGGELTALCDHSESNIARQAKNSLPPFVTSDYDAFLASNIEAVIIATPASTHFSLARRALLAGKHVLVEKPFTTDSFEALQLIDLADRLGLRLAVGHTYVFHPAVQYLRTLVETGALGDLFYVYSSRLNFGLLQPDIDVIWDLAPHDLSILSYTLGRQPLAAGARGSAFVSDGPCEIAHLDLELLGGPAAHIYLSWLEPHKVRRFTIVGSERTVVYDDLAAGESIRIYDRKISMMPGPFERPLPNYWQGGATVPHLDEHEPLKREDEHFVQSIQTGEPLLSNGWSGLEAVRIMEAASRSLAKGGVSQLIETDLMRTIGPSPADMQASEMDFVSTASRRS